MLTLLASALLLAGRVAGQMCTGMSGGMTQSGNNYVVDVFTSTLYFSYAINKCTGVSLVDSSKYYMYTCKQDDDEMWWVTKTSYTTEDCSGTATEVAVWGENDAEPGETGYFKCDGKNNYAEIKISLDSTCGVYTTIAGGLGGCASNPSITLDTKFYCSSTSALVELYANPTVINSTYTMCDDDHLYCGKWTFPTTCTQAATLLQQTVYGLMTKCALTESGNDGDDGDDSDSSASSQFTLLGVVIALVAGFWQ